MPTSSIVSALLLIALRQPFGVIRRPRADVTDLGFEVLGSGCPGRRKLPAKGDDAPHSREDVQQCEHSDSPSCRTRARLPTASDHKYEEIQGARKSGRGTSGTTVPLMPLLDHPRSDRRRCCTPASICLASNKVAPRLETSVCPLKSPIMIWLMLLPTR